MRGATSPQQRSARRLSTILWLRSWRLLSPIIGTGLGMNQNAKQFRRVLLETDFHLRLDIMDPRERQTIRQSAMAGEIHASAYPLHHEVVRVEHFWKMRCHNLQSLLQRSVADDFFRRLNRRRFTLNMGQN